MADVENDELRHGRSHEVKDVHADGVLVQAQLRQLS